MLTISYLGLFCLQPIPYSTRTVGSLTLAQLILPLPCSHPFHGSPVLPSTAQPSLQGPAQPGSACVFNIIPYHLLPGSRQAEPLSIPLMSGLSSHGASAHAVLCLEYTSLSLSSFPLVNSYLASWLSFRILQKACTDTPSPPRSGLGAPFTLYFPRDSTHSCVSADSRLHRLHWPCPPAAQGAFEGWGWVCCA